MSDRYLYNLGRVFAVVLVIAQAVITQCITNFVDDLSMTRAQVAVLSLVVTGISTAMLFLPQVQREAGNKRGDSSDDA